MTLLEEAVRYKSIGFSVWPCNKVKFPSIGWKHLQQRLPTDEELEKWFGNGNAPSGVGVVTGAISGIVVVDVDDMVDGIKNLSQYIDPMIETPMQQTPSGGLHLFFKHPGFKMPNNVNGIKGCDFRGDGGIVPLPPTFASYDKKGKHFEGNYVWIKSIFDVPLAELPERYVSAYKSFVSFSFSAVTDLNESSGSQSQVSKSQASQQESAFFSEGMRDNSLFHAAFCLARGQAEPDFLRNIMEILAENCNPPFPKRELETKIQSAVERASKKDKSVTQDIKEWLESVNGQFQVSDYYTQSAVVSKSDKHAAIVAFKKMCDQGILERIGVRAGTYRKIEQDYVVQNWWEGEGKPLDFQFPMGVQRLAKVFPGNIILLEGQKSQGKSAFALEVCRMNRKLFPGYKVRYQNVEMSDNELSNRFKKYPESLITIDEWRTSVEFIRRTSEWWDLIIPDGLNVIDYLLEYEKSYMIADFIFKIHQKLKNGVALVIVQRDPLKPYPTGGRGVRDIPRLILSLVHHKLKLEDVKSFAEGLEENPTGLVRDYKLVNWWNVKPQNDWHREEDERYDAITKKNRKKDPQFTNED